MKITNVTLTAMALLTPWLFAENKDHEQESKDPADHSKEAHAEVKAIEGPNKGRVVTSTEPHLEFFVTADRKILITFLDGKNMPVALKEPVVSAIGGDRSAPTRMTFSPSGEGGALMSDVPLPEGNNIPIILQVKSSPEADNITEKFNVNFSQCPTCDHPEYACTCGH